MKLTFKSPDGVSEAISEVVREQEASLNINGLTDPQEAEDAAEALAVFEDELRGQLSKLLRYSEYLTDTMRVIKKD